MLDDLHQMSTCRTLVEAALKNHPLRLQTVAQAKAADSGSSVNDAHALAALRRKRGRPVKEKGAQKAATKPSRKSQRISSTTAESEGGGEEGEEGGEENKQGAGGKGKGGKGKGGKGKGGKGKGDKGKGDKEKGDKGAKAKGAKAASAPSADANGADAEANLPTSRQPPLLKDAMAEILARERSASGTAAGSAGSEQQLAKIAGLDKKVAELGAELKLYAHMSL